MLLYGLSLLALLSSGTLVSAGVTYLRDYDFSALKFLRNDGLFRRKRASSETVDTLYDFDEPILQFNHNNFSEIVFKADRPFLVEFYMSWCGHCRAFAPKYVQLAKNIEGWDELVSVGAVNCAIEANRALCSSNGVKYVPYIRYFRTGAQNYSDAIVVEQAEPRALRKTLVNHLIEDFSENPRENRPSLIDANETTDFWSSAPESATHLAIVFDSSNLNSTSSVELMLDLWSERNWLYAVRAASSHPLVASLKIFDLPAVVVFKRNQSSPVFVSDFRSVALNEIVAFNPNPPDPVFQLQVQATTISVPQLSKEELAKRYFLSERDLLYAVRYSLLDEVEDSGEKLTSEQVRALRQYVTLLQKYWPMTTRMRNTLRYLNLNTDTEIELPYSNRSRAFFKDLKVFLDSQIDRQLSVKAWHDEFTRLEEEHKPFPEAGEWVHCKGSSPRFRGYTCGLWMMFHTLSVNSYLEDASSGSFEPRGLIHGIRGWVKNFFGCADCAAHFLSMTNETLPIDQCVKYPSDTVLYLWKAHNRVNARLSGDATEDPALPKLQFPPQFLCDKCGGPDNGKDSRSSPYGCDVDPGWDLRSIMRYLIRFYTAIRPVTQ